MVFNFYVFAKGGGEKETGTLGDIEGEKCNLLAQNIAKLTHSHSAKLPSTIIVDRETHSMFYFSFIGTVSIYI